MWLLKGPETVGNPDFERAECDLDNDGEVELKMEPEPKERAEGEVVAEIKLEDEGDIIRGTDVKAKLERDP